LIDGVCVEKDEAVRGRGLVYTAVAVSGDAV
jgi:hypothetical protein